MKTMDPTAWSPYSQQTFTHGSPRSLGLPPSTPTEDSHNNYGNPNNLLMSPCQGLQSIPPTPGASDSTAHQASLLNSHYESTLLSPPLRSTKESSDFFSESIYNGICKENPPGMQDFTQNSGLAIRNDIGCLPSENSNSGFNSQVPSVSFQPKNIDRPSPGPFGVLPHEAVMTRPNRYDNRNKDKFVSPISKPPSTPFNNMPYPDQDVSSIYTSTPLSTHSVFSSENASQSPLVNSVTSPNMSNFSSPSDYYSSPKNTFGAYNSMQSPVPQSPSVAQHSYPSSPFTSMDPVSHIPNAPPCSPMNTAGYGNKMQDRVVIGNQVPQRNPPQVSQHSPSNMAGGNSAICYNQQPPTPAMVHHGHQSTMSKTPDYHPDYSSVFSHNHISPSSYTSNYPAMHPSQMACEDPSMTPRPHGSHQNLPHDNRLQYPHSSMPPSSVGSPSYMHNKSAGVHDMMFGSCSSNMPTGQSMHSARYQDCTASVIDPNRNRTMHHQHPSSMMPPMMTNSRHYNYPGHDLVDDKNALDMFNSHVDSGIHNPDNCQSSISSFLENDLPILESAMLNHHEMRLPEPTHPPLLNVPHDENPDRSMLMHADMTNIHDNSHHTNIPQKNMNFYESNMEICRPRAMQMNSFPRRRGRRGRRRKGAEIHQGISYCRYQTLKNECNMNIYNNGFQIDRNKFPEYHSNNYNNNNNEFQSNDCFENYQKSYKERLDAYEFHTTHYAPSKYQSVRKKDESRVKTHSDRTFHKRKWFLTVEEELSFLGEMKFPREELKDSHTFMKTRNKDSEGFLQCYKNFLEVRRTRRDDDVELVKSPIEHKPVKEHKEKKSPKHQPKLIIRMGRCNNPGEWRLTETYVSPEHISDSNESASDSNVNTSSHKTKEDESNSSDNNKTKGIGNSDSEDSIKHSGRKFFKHSSYSGKNDAVSSHGTNSQTFLAGQTLTNEKPPGKKRGRKAKRRSASPSKKKSPIKSSDYDPLKSLPHPIKEEIISDEEGKVASSVSSRRPSLRSSVSASEDHHPGPSVKLEPVDLSSDEIDVLDDSDSDPAWTPSARIPKVSDALKSSVATPGAKKQRRKYTRRKKDPTAATIPKKQTKLSTASAAKKAKTAVEVKIKVEERKRKTDLFVIAKADLGKNKPSIWRMDNEMKMLQRFDPYEDQGMQLHRNTYSYAAWNEVTRSFYVQAKIKVLSYSRMLYVVQYLGLEETSSQNFEGSQLPVNPLRENFEVFLQTLISQALDPNFLSEITSENDEYFLNNIKEIEKVTEDKKKLLLKETWDKELIKCSEIYPCVNILPTSNNEGLNCQVCQAAKGEKLLQFYGPPYDRITLGSTDSLLSNKTQFNVCAACSTTVSLYSKLHHQKYNFFVKCRTKMNLVKGDKALESHVLLDHCLQDSTWVNMLFHELEEVWRDCDKSS